jgi:predicted phosphodiesterase
MPELVLAHVSDIHFRQWAGGPPWDVNVPLRAALERDLESLATDLGPFRAIVATGDIAFSGKAPEYDQAQEWLGRLTALAGCRTEDVWVVPGNHDVDRSKVDSSDLVKEFHRGMRECDRLEIGGLLHHHLAEDEAGGAVYLSPLEAYVTFATPYQCDISPKKPWWECGIPFVDADASLRIRGLTSVLISDSMDDQDGNRPMIGPAQVAIVPLPRTITMTLCHHPLSWLRDEDEVVESLGSTAEIQLWGHRHRQATRPIDGNVHLYAGAVHPARGETDWEPRYNVLRLHAPSPEGIARVDIFPRIWRRQTGSFGPDLNSLEGRLFEQHNITLHYRTAAPHHIKSPEREDAKQETPAMSMEMSPPGDPRRRLGFRFGTLPYQRRLAIARDLGLLSDEARDLSDRDLFETALAEAVANGRLPDLWESVERAHGSTTEGNPFVE